jgi:hypothetical protein
MHNPTKPTQTNTKETRKECPHSENKDLMGDLLGCEQPQPQEYPLKTKRNGKNSKKFQKIRKNEIGNCKGIRIWERATGRKFWFWERRSEQGGEGSENAVCG